MAIKNIELNSFDLSSWETPSSKDSRLLIATNYVRSIFELSAVDVPSYTDMRALHTKLKEALTDSDLLSTISRKEEKLLPWVFIQPVDGDPLFELEGAIEAVFGWLFKESRYQALPAFVQVLLMEYPHLSRRFPDLKTAIKDLLNEATTHKAKLIRDWTEDTGLFSQDVMQRFTKQVITASADSCFNSFRLHRGLIFGKFSQVGLQNTLTHLRSALSSMPNEQQTKVVNDLISTLIDNRDFRFPTLKADLADGLLLSYQASPPFDSLKKNLKKIMLDYYGDPRISKVGWQGVSEEAIQVMKSWMVENTMNDFFALLSHVALTDSTADNHWQYRKRFWNSYLKKGVIQEAWVALGPKAKSEAKSFISQGSTFASLRGVIANHSALIMVIGDVLITEWSHSGKYRLWTSDLGRPRLYRRSYFRSEIVSDCDYEGAHHSSDSGGWQYNLSNLINNLTGISVTNREYMND